MLPTPTCLVPVSDGYAALLARLGELYESSFPDVARIATSRLRDLIGHCPAMTFNAIVAGGTMVGMAVMWDLGTFRYLQYLATLAEYRNSGHGSRTLARLLAESPTPLVGEVEPPIEPRQVRRLRFYTRNGMFVATRHPAILNAAHPGNDLWLIASQHIASLDECQQRIIGTVYRTMHPDD